jgi:hypothetical protein
MTTVNSTAAYAKLNIQLSTTLTAEELLKIESVLHDAATWSNAEDFEVFFSEKDNIAGVSIPVGEDIAEVLEAGSALGFCNRMFEESGLSNGTVWHSLVSVSGAEIYSPL